MKTAIIIGHDKTSAGAYSGILNVSEYVYNSEVASYLSCVGDIYKRPSGMGYKGQMQALADKINPKGYDLVLELHFNSFNEKANGCETVGFKGSKKGEAFGKDFCNVITKHYGTKNRGHKVSEPNGRGYWFTKLMNPPALILEPFFGDNYEAMKFANEKEYACILKEWLIEISK